MIEDGQKRLDAIKQILLDLTSFDISESDKAKVWLLLLADSLRQQMRLDGKYEQADKVWKMLCAANANKLNRFDISLKDLKEYRDQLACERNMFDADLVELEIF